LTNSLSILEDTKINVQPNPTSASLFVQSENMIQSLNVFGIRGEKVLSINSIGQKEYPLDLSNFDNGIYLIEVNTTAGSHISRIVKE
jgi:hypothetical protein